MYDLRVPVETYQREIDRLKLAASTAAKDVSQGNKGKKEQERFNTLIDKLKVSICSYLLYAFRYNYRGKLFSVSYDSSVLNSFKFIKN